MVLRLETLLKHCKRFDVNSTKNPTYIYLHNLCNHHEDMKTKVFGFSHTFNWWVRDVKSDQQLLKNSLMFLRNIFCIFVILQPLNTRPVLVHCPQCLRTLSTVSKDTVYFYEVTFNLCFLKKGAFETADFMSICWLDTVFSKPSRWPWNVTK